LGGQVIAENMLVAAHHQVIGTGGLGKRKNSNRVNDVFVLIDQCETDLVVIREDIERLSANKKTLSCSDQIKQNTDELQASSGQAKVINLQLDNLWEELTQLSGNAAVRPAKVASSKNNLNQSTF
jgi:hypothetical protein